MAPNRFAIGSRSERVAGTMVSWLEADADAEVPVLYVHGVPTSSRDWVPFLERTGGIAIDLPGFGDSEKPQTFDYSLGGYNAFIQAFVARMELERFSLVVHDWGALALVSAQELRDRVERLVVIDAVPLLAGYRWHRIARVWRTPLLGEMTMGLTTKVAMSAVLRRSRHRSERLPGPMLDAIWRDFDHGTQRAILKLYRSAGPEVLEAAGERLGDIGARALVVWGAEDPYIEPRFAHEYARRLGGDTDVEIVEAAGHWPWIDRPEVVDRVTAFLAGARVAH